MKKNLWLLGLLFLLVFAGCPDPDPDPVEEEATWSDIKSLLQAKGTWENTQALPAMPLGVMLAMLELLDAEALSELGEFLEILDAIGEFDLSAINVAVTARTGAIINASSAASGTISTGAHTTLVFSGEDDEAVDEFWEALMAMLEGEEGIAINLNYPYSIDIVTAGDEDTMPITAGELNAIFQIHRNGNKLKARAGEEYGEVIFNRIN